MSVLEETAVGDDIRNEGAGPGLTTRGADRRGVTAISPPPFQTREGLVLVERRSCCEHRANWIHEFTMNTAGDGTTNTEP